MKQSNRVKKTQAAIESAYLALFAEDSGQKITVKDICERSGINRTTFYKYYADGESLAQSVRQRMLEELERLMQETVPADHSDIYEMISQIILRVYRDEWMRCFFLVYREKAFRDRVISLLDQYYIRPRYKSLDSEEDWILYTFFHAGLIGLMESWLEGGMKQSPEKLANQVIAFIKAVRGR